MFIDKKMTFGRHLEINEILNFLTDITNQKRILSINGGHGNGCGNIARFSIKYVMNRHHFEGGAFHIDCNNKVHTKSVLQAISKKLMLSTQDRDEILEMIKRCKILLLFDNCNKLIEKDFENFVDMLFSIIEQTEFVKTMVITCKDSIKEFENHKITRFLSIIQIDPLKKKESAKMLFMMNENNDTFVRIRKLNMVDPIWRTSFVLVIRIFSKLVSGGFRYRRI